jgi:hypothetical protein
MGGSPTTFGDHYMSLPKRCELDTGARIQFKVYRCLAWRPLMQVVDLLGFLDGQPR